MTREAIFFPPVYLAIALRLKEASSSMCFPHLNKLGLLVTVTGFLTFGEAVDGSTEPSSTKAPYLEEFT